MTPHSLSTTLTILLVAARALAAGDVTVSLTSPSAGSFVPPGATVDWTITAVVSTGDNAGLALFSADFVQDPANPQLFDLPSAASVPAEMQGFSRPAGLSNAGPGGLGSGYGGTPVGPGGQKNLRQIGGAQNTFGVPGAAAGLDVDVDAGVGQQPGGQTIASDTFAAPSTPGTYTFSLASVFANTLDAVNPAPQSSPAGAATVVAQPPSAVSFSFSVCLAGDVNADAAVSLPDVPLFVDLLLGASPPDEQAACAADLNADGNIDGRDITLFVQALT